MTLGQITELIEAQREVNAASRRSQKRGDERPATLADVAMLARLGVNPLPG